MSRSPRRALLSRVRHLLAGLLAFCISVTSASAAKAFQTGITGWSGMRGPICNSCHAGGVAPAVRIEGSDSIAAGATEVFRLVVESGSPAQTAAGFDLSATAGSLQALPGEGVRFFEGELTHSQPKLAQDGIVTWDFSWTAPDFPGEFTFFVAANSVNLNTTTSGDRATAITRTVSVAAPPTQTATPFETPTPTASETPTPSENPTPVVTPTMTPSSTPTPSPTPSPLACLGDCNEDHIVAVSDLVLALDVALGTASAAECPAIDPEGTGAVPIDRLVRAVDHALHGCP